MRRTGDVVPRAVLVLLALALLVGPGCRRWTKAAADRESYALLAARRPAVPQLRGDLDVDAAQRVADAVRTRTTYDLTLRDALALGAAASRDYLAEREDVYLAALELTGVQSRFSPRWAAFLAGTLDADRGGIQAGGDLGASVSQSFEQGGGLSLGQGTSLLQALADRDPVRLLQSLFNLDLTLPLARGYGWVAREDLTQAERDTLYAMRGFARFQQGFTVDIATRFYRVLQQRDTWQNEERTYESLKVLLDRQVALGAQGAGRIADFEVDQTRQDLLEADDRRQQARAAYEAGIDRFKLDLGIPVAVPVQVDDGDLERLRERGARPAPYDLGQALAQSGDHRLDLINAREQEEDALRRVLVAKDALRPDVQISLLGSLAGPDQQPFNLHDLDPAGLLGLTIDLPFERTEERNAWRAALIQAVRVRRDREGLEDQIALAVRQAMRDLDQAARSLAIQREGVRLAERRVESTGLLLEAGRATTRDRLDAENALVRARNAFTAALVDHAVARLELERDVGTLVVDDHAWWTEAPPPAGTPAPPPASASTTALPPAALPPAGAAPPAAEPAPSAE